MRLGIDLGGTKTEIIALADDGEELLRERVPSVPDYRGTLEAIAGAKGELFAGLDESATAIVNADEDACAKRTAILDSSSRARLVRRTRGS